MRLSKEQSQRIQFLRALAIVAVVVIHCCPPGLPQAFVRPFVNFCVALFVFLSGCLTKTGYSNLCAFYRRRLSRVLPPYVIWTCLYTLMNRHNLAGGGAPWPSPSVRTC